MRPLADRGVERVLAAWSGIGLDLALGGVILDALVANYLRMPVAQRNGLVDGADRYWPVVCILATRG